jgi:hypothetical protein
MSDSDAAGEPVHGGGESVEPVWPHQRLDGPRWLAGRKIVSKSHSLDYDPLALAVLFLGLGAFGLFVFI